MKKDTLFIFLILAIIVVLLQFTVLDLALKIGFKPDDWILYLSFKTLGNHPILKLMEVWNERGIYTTYQVYYIGLLQNIAIFSHLSIPAVNLISKAIATIAVFPLVQIVFKNTKLAVLATLFFAISYSSVGPLEFAVKGSDYIAIFWMFLFLLSYYSIVKNHPRDFRRMIISLILLSLTIIFSPIRSFPLLFFLPILELSQLEKNRTKENIKSILVRILVYYLPIGFVVLHSPDTVNGLVSIPKGLFKSIAEGNWHLLLSPFSGIGYTFITNDYWGRLFGKVNIQTINAYVTFLFGGPLIIYSLLTVIIASVTSKRPKVFFIRTLLINIILEILVFFAATNSQHLIGNPALSYDPTGLYSALFGIYICVIGLLSFIEWKENRENYLVMAQWMGILFLSVFTLGTWAFAPFGTTFFATNYYLVISSAGSALFLSALILGIYYRIIKLNRLKKIIFLSGLLLFIFIYSLISVKEISTRFDYLLKNGRSKESQKLLQERFKEKLGNFDNTKPTLFYFDTSDLSEGGPYYSEGFLIPFPFWMHFKGSSLVAGCLEILYLNEHQQLRPYLKEQNEQKGFYYRSLCLENGKSFYKDIFYKPENFYAYKIKDKDFIDIKKEVLDELGF